MPDGCELFARVRDYAALGDHRTGTACDRDTLAWFASCAERLGGTVAVERFSFPMFEAETEATVAGAVVDSLPLYYSAVGSFDRLAARIVEVDVTHCDDAEAHRDIARHVEVAVGRGEPGLLVATRSATGDLYALNTSPAAPPGFPVLLVPAAAVGGERAGTLTLRSTLAASTSASILARFGDRGTAPPLVVTTPLSGWFRCAGERGTGIAVALHVAERIAARRSVLLIATSGHELGHLGALSVRRTGHVDPAWPILHIGSCVAASRRLDAGAPPALTDGLTAVVGIGDGLPAGLGAELRRRSISLRCPQPSSDAAGWQGESMEWAGPGRRMISIAGVAPLFHCPGDLPEAATSPILLADAAGLIHELGLALCGAGS